jgi:hypothetical protein
MITGSKEFGVPFGRDRLIPIWIATRAVLLKNRVIYFGHASEILEVLGLRVVTRCFWQDSRDSSQLR